MQPRMDPLPIVFLLGAAGAIAISRLGRSGAETAEPARPTRPKQRSPARREEPEPTPAMQPAAGTRKRSAASATPSSKAPESAAPDSPPATPDPASKPPAERRKHPRLRSDQTFSVTPFAGRELIARCHDVSLGGMRFAVEGYELREDDLVRVAFSVGEETVCAIGRVVRSRKPDPTTSEISLEFVRIDPWAERLLEEALQAGT